MRVSFPGETMHAASALEPISSLGSGFRSETWPSGAAAAIESFFPEGLCSDLADKKSW